jgi:hypothetical protein
VTLWRMPLLQLHYPCPSSIPRRQPGDPTILSMISTAFKVYTLRAPIRPLTDIHSPRLRTSPSPAVRETTTATSPLGRNSLPVLALRRGSAASSDARLTVRRAESAVTLPRRPRRLLLLLRRRTPPPPPLPPPTARRPRPARQTTPTTTPARPLPLPPPRPPRSRRRPLRARPAPAVRVLLAAGPTLAPSSVSVGPTATTLRPAAPTTLATTSAASRRGTTPGAPSTSDPATRSASSSCPCSGVRTRSETGGVSSPAGRRPSRTHSSSTSPTRPASPTSRRATRSSTG